MNEETGNDTEYEDDFIIILTIDGTEYEEEECEVTDPNKTIRQLIASIIVAFDLPKIDGAGNPLQYLLGLTNENDDEPEIIEIEDENGREQTLADYGILPGDHLHLISVPIAGGGPCIYTPREIKTKQPFWAKLKSCVLKRDQVFSSLFAPESVQPGANMMIQLYLFKDGERDIVIAEAIQADRVTREVSYVPLFFDIKRGEAVDVTLNVDGISLPNNKKTIVWRGRYTKCCFNVKIPEDFDSYSIYGEVLISVNGKPYGELSFITYISNGTRGTGTAGVNSKKYDKIFISYAHQDAERVKHLALAYKAQGVDYFYDRDKLLAGDVYEEKIIQYIDTADLFILCWSQNAEKSDYVKKEVDRALKRAYPQIEREEATLRFYPISIPPRAEYPDNLKDIYNFEEL